jgi:NAD(P)-dependent dehydrogenase (short-subunit alcohol dehydrogenase family)
MRPLRKPIILITGCASGVGLAIAELLYKQNNYRVIATARAHNLPKLKERFVEDGRFLIRALDVTSEDERAALIHELDEKFQGVDILVNNAGISFRAVLEHMTEEDERRQMAVNYFGPVALTRLVLPRMRERGRGKVINISSVSGMLAMPTMSSYSASKYALEGMSESLWYEVRPFGINVSLIQPGFIRSRSIKNVYYTDLSKAESQREGPYSDYYKHMTPFIERLMDLSRTSPQSVARLTLKVIRTEHPPLWIPASVDAWMFYYLRRLVPRRWLMPMLFFFLPGARRWGEKYSRRRK